MNGQYTQLYVLVAIAIAIHSYEKQLTTSLVSQQLWWWKTWSCLHSYSHSCNDLWYVYESGLKVGHTCWSIWPTDLQNNPDVTHLWPRSWSFLFKSNVTWHEKFLIWNNAIDFFILGRIQNQSLAQTSWRWNLWTPHASKQLEIISWFHTNDNSVHSSDPKFTHLPDANTVF